MKTRNAATNNNNGVILWNTLSHTILLAKCNNQKVFRSYGSHVEIMPNCGVVMTDKVLMAGESKNFQLPLPLDIMALEVFWAVNEITNSKRLEELYRKLQVKILNAEFRGVKGYMCVAGTELAWISVYDLAMLKLLQNKEDFKKWAYNPEKNERIEQAQYARMAMQLSSSH